MQNPSYLILSRHRVYYFRWPLPKALRVTGRTAFIKLSLGTREPKEALLLANTLAYHADSFVKKERVHLMDYAEAKNLLENHFAEILSRRKTAIDKDGPLLPDRVASIQWTIDELFEDQERRTPLEDYEVEKIDLIVSKYGLNAPKGSEAYERITSVYRLARARFFENVIAYSNEQKNFSFDKQANRSGLSTPSKTSNYTLPGQRLREVISKFVKEKDKSGTWGIRAKEERLAFFDYLIELLGEDFGFAKLDITTARHIKDTLMETPANRGKLKATSGKPLIEQIKIEGVQKLSVASVNKYLQAYSSLYEWGVSNGYVDKNPFVKLALKESSKKKRDWFRPEQIRTMLAEIDRGKSGLADSDMKYWGVLIGLYTGARLNEICSLTANDIKQEKDIWYFDINEEGEKKSLKTNAATRLVPIHSELIRRGFLVYVERVKTMKGQDLRLLHTLTYTEKEGWGRKLTRWFSDKFLPELGLKKSNTSFHSMRHTAITVMRQAGVDQHLVRALVGHEPDGVTEGTYTHQYKLAQLKEALEKLDYSHSD